MVDDKVIGVDRGGAMSMAGLWLEEDGGEASQDRDLSARLEVACKLSQFGAIDWSLHVSSTGSGPATYSVINSAPLSLR